MNKSLTEDDFKKYLQKLTLEEAVKTFVQYQRVMPFVWANLNGADLQKSPEPPERLELDNS